MQFVTPIPFAEALDKIGDRSPIGSVLSSSEWSDVPVALREQAFFSSRVESARVLQSMQDALTDFLANNREVLPDGQTALKTGSRADFVDQMQAMLASQGIERGEGGLTDITSEKRLGLVFNVQTQQAEDYGYWRQGMDADVLDEFPAQRFIRVEDVKEPRQSHAQYENQVYLKTDPIWAGVINADFGVPWGPWGWGCGHDVEDVDRAEAEALGLIQPGEKLQPQKQLFTENLQASSRGLEPDLLDKLKADFGDKVIFDGDTMQWNSETVPDEQLVKKEVPAAPQTTLDEVLEKLGIAGKAEASTEDIAALREELIETAPVSVEDMVRSIEGTTLRGAMTVDGIKQDVQEFLNFFPPGIVQQLPKLKLQVGHISDNGVYSGGGKVSLNAKLSAAERRRVVFHELMHWVHREGGEEYRKAIRTHFMERTRGESVVHLPGYSWGTDGKTDKWYEAYAGRIYPFETRPEGLEIPTRYIEWLTMPPEKMALLWNDADFRETMQIVLRGLF